MKDFREVISDYLKGNNESRANRLIDQWQSQHKDRKQTLQCIRENLNKCHKQSKNYQPKTENAYDEILQKINTNAASSNQYFLLNKIPAYYRFAAVFLLLLLPFSFYYFFSAGNIQTQQDALLQLATNAEFNEITLEDGTHVWLHQHSSLEYPTHFNASIREISIVGEAFFDVAHEPDRPFLIRTAAHSEILVMGTSLNVRAYGDEKEEEIAVASGEVVYRCALNSRPEVKLDKGNCAIWHMETNHVETMEETDPNTFSWKDHLLIFKDADCRSFEKILERYFRVEVEMLDSSLLNTRFSAEFKDKNLQQILDYFNAQAKVVHEMKKDTCYLWKR